jgi:membrane fusion protein (multidrug efflux system)
MTNRAPTLFRREALEQRSGNTLSASLLRIDTESAAWGFRLLVAGMLVALAFFCFGHVNEYATGPAFVRVEQHLTLTAGLSTLVSEVDVAPGDKVEAGAILIRFRAATEDAELEAASREFDDQLAKLLQRPDDRAARDALGTLRARRELARAQVEQRTLRAPCPGTVGDVRVRPGQMVETGASLVELQEPGSEATVVALVPGRYRPLIHPGSTLRFEIDGFHRRAYELPVDTVGDQIVGPAEAARYVGRDSADAFSVAGPVVLVQARIHSARFDADGDSFGFANGMYGKAETLVRSEPIAYAFLPGLKPWVERMKPSSWFGPPLGGHRG